ncbi:MAG: tetratricopeptide repeat protein [Patescibacteria group bacterium]|jgi:tetratricopeptide (TPR) repeat protein
MTLFNIIIFGIIIVCLLVIIFIVGRKFSKLAQINLETLPEVKASATKERIVRAKLERNILIPFRHFLKKAKPAAVVAGEIVRRLVEKTLEWEKKYSRPLKTGGKTAETSAQKVALVAAGYDLLAAGKEAEAEKKFIDAIALDPQAVEAYHGLGELYWEQGKLAEAQETFEYIIKLNADNYDAHSHLGNIAAAKGDWAKARDYHQKSISLDSQAAVHYLDIARVYQEMGEPAKAYESLEKAVGLEPNNPRNLDALLNLSIMMNKKKEARDLLKKLREVNPENQKLDEFEGMIRKMK